MVKRRVLRGLLSLLTLGALGVHALEAQPAPTLPNGALWALGAAGLWVLYGAWLRLEKPLRPLRLWALAALFAGVMTLGESFGALGTAEWVQTHTKAAALFFAGRVPLYFAGMRLLLNALLQKRTQPVRALKAWQVAAALYACWLPWFVCLFPGTLSTDSVSQLMILFGLEPLTNANPICQTGLVALFRWLGDALGGGPDMAIALYCIIQSVLMARLLGSLVCEVERSAAPRALVWGSFLFYALCPIFPVFAFCVGKDTNFAMAVLFLSLECWRVSQGQRGWKRAACASVAAVLCVVLRNPGIYLAILTLALLLIWAIKNRVCWQTPLCGLLSAALVFAALHGLIIPSLDIAPMPATEEYSVPLQQIARVAAGDGLTDQQKQALSGVLPVEELKAAYNGELSDPVKDLWYQDASEQAQATFWPTWLEIVKQNPMTCASATFHNTYGYLYPGYVSTIKPTLIMGNHSTRTAHVDGLFDYTVNPLSAKTKALTDGLNENPLYRVIISPGLYGWLTLLAVLCLMKKASGKQLLCTVPALFTLAGCMLSAVNGYFRYAMPLYLSAPLLMWLLRQGLHEN